MTFSSQVNDRRKLVPGGRVSMLFRRLKSLPRNSLHTNLSLLSSVPARIASRFYYPRVFADFGPRSIIRSPLLIQNPHFISIGSDVSIRNGVRMQSIQISPERTPVLRIGNGTYIEQFVHIICHNRV